MNWENEPAPDWISAQNLDVSEPTVLASVPSTKTKRSNVKENSFEPWICGPTTNSDSSDDSDYEGEPPVKKVEFPVPSPKKPSKKRPRYEDDLPNPPKKVRFVEEEEESVMPCEDDNLHKIHSAVKKVKKRTLAEQRERKAQLRTEEKRRKDKFFNQMLRVNKVQQIEDKSNLDLLSSKLPDLTSDTDSDVTITDVNEKNGFKFVPLLFNQRKAVCQRINLIVRKMDMGHSQVGEMLKAREPRVTRVKGDGNCLFRSLTVATTGWEVSHLRIRQLVCDHIHDVGPYNSKDASDGPLYLRQTNMRKDTVFGTDVEIFSAAQVLATDIYVYHRYGESMKWLYFPCVHGSGNWKNAIYLDNRTGNGITGHFDYVTGLKN